MTAPSVADQRLGVPLPRDDPAASATTAAALREAAERLAALARGVAGLLPVRRWAGVASAAADDRLLATAAALAAERGRLAAAAGALESYSHGVAVAQRRADDARRLLAGAYAAQQRADAADPRRVAGRAAAGWGGQLDGPLDDPAALTVLRRARGAAWEARQAHDRAAHRLVDELGALSGRRVARATVPPRVLLDVAGLVPVVGDAVDLVSTAVSLRQRRWGDAVTTGIAAVPGPVGWVAGGLKILRTLRRAGEVERVVADSAGGERVAVHLGRLAVRGRRRDVRLLSDDAEVERFYRETLAPLGRTREQASPLGRLWVTDLPGGGSITLRPQSRSGGWTIDVNDVPGSPVRRVHRSGTEGSR